MSGWTKQVRQYYMKEGKERKDSKKRRKEISISEENK
jgi:hypothetical protein